MEEGTMVFNADSEGVDRGARSYIEELVWELLLEQGLSPSAYDWKLVVDWQAEEQPVRFQVVSYRKPEAERKTFQDHGGEWHFFDSAEEAEDFTLKLEQDGYWPEGDRWVVSALDRNDCCLECWEVPTDEEDAA